jgi:hypothetical protein
MMIFHMMITLRWDHRMLKRASVSGWFRGRRKMASSCAKLGFMSLRKARAPAGGSSIGWARRHTFLILSTPSRCIARVSLLSPWLLDVRALGRARPRKTDPPSVVRGRVDILK